MASLFDSLSESEGESPLTVSELVELLDETLEEQYGNILLTGEISSWKLAGSGHAYFSLSDGEGGVDAVAWRSALARWEFRPGLGDEVLCRGRVRLYRKTGRLQFYADSMRPVGAGAAQRALEELRRKLAAEGLFSPERKRPLPLLPACVGVVTSRSGAAVEDIRATVNRRFPGTRLVLSPATVQGERAPAEICAALARLERWGGCDVVILGRGGGASEDLVAFQDERVVRAVAAFPVPVVSAVGHEIDVTLVDLVADLRAATPTAAAEAVVPVRDALRAEVTSQRDRLRHAMRRGLAFRREQVRALRAELPHPGRRLEVARERTDRAAERLEAALRERVQGEATDLHRRRERLRDVANRLTATARHAVEAEDRRLHATIRARVGAGREGLARLAGALDALSPLGVLDRGYSLVRNAEGRLVRRARDLRAGQHLHLKFREGEALARVVRGEDD